MNTLTVLHHETSDAPRPRRRRDFTLVRLQDELLERRDDDATRRDESRPT
jgi:hypothetical protein